MQQADLIIYPEWIYTAEEDANSDSQTLTQQGVVILDGKIVDLAERAQIEAQWQSEQTLEKPGCLLLPGFINSHTHASMNLMRGIANDLPLMEWLEQHIWPAEAAHVSEQYVYDGTQLAIAEMIRSGTSCFNDMYFFPNAAIQAALDSGMRISAGIIAIDFPSAYAANADEYLSKGLALHQQHQHNPLCSFMLAPHAPYTVSDDVFTRIAQLAEQQQLGIHLHLHETEFEVGSATAQSNERPFARLKRLGVLGKQTLAVHMTQLNSDEIADCAEQGISVAHCPESNLKLASGFCPTHRLWQQGVNVCLGTDGAASNNDLDMLGEMRSASLLSKAVAGDATALNAAQSLQMATINGAKALGLADQTGSIRIGKAADLQLIDLNTIETQPCYDPLAQVVYSASRDQITHLWCAGQALMQDRQLTTLDETKIIANAKQWHEKISA